MSPFSFKSPLFLEVLFSCSVVSWEFCCSVSCGVSLSSVLSVSFGSSSSLAVRSYTILVLSSGFVPLKSPVILSPFNMVTEIGISSKSASAVNLRVTKGFSVSVYNTVRITDTLIPELTSEAIFCPFPSVSAGFQVSP